MSMTFTAPAAPGGITDEQRRVTLRRYKAWVTSLLVVAAVIFLSCSWWMNQPGGAPIWVGYLRAAAEAGMVGGLADWFAVTAIFRHPLGIPIPHTALVRRNKDQIGGQLSGFVNDNFLNEHTIVEKISQADLPRVIGRWLVQPDHAQRVSAEAGEFIAKALRSVDPQEATGIIMTHIMPRLARPEWGPPAGRVLEAYIADGKAEPVVDDIIDWAYRKLLTQRETVVRLVDERMPVWAPRFARHFTGNKVYDQAVEWLGEVRDEPDHELRQAVARGLAQFAQDLQYDPSVIARVEAVKSDILAADAMLELPAVMWAQGSAALLEQAEDSHSALRQAIASKASDYGHTILTDEDTRAALDRTIIRAATWTARNYATKFTDIISETISRWDAREVSEKIELMVGKDLQYIRVNGTVIGALVGTVIYAVNHMLFGIA